MKEEELTKPAEAAKAFFANPPLFAANNFLVFACGDTSEFDGTPVYLYFDDESMTYSQTGKWLGGAGNARRFHGESIHTLYLKACGKNQSGAFKAYICPYENNKLRQVVLSDDADFVFTPRMDGCSFGIGMPNEKGEILVAHVNRMDEQKSLEDKDSMQKAQRDDLEKLEKKIDLFEPKDYRWKYGEKAQFVSFTFGVRNPNKNTWTFYAQVAEDREGVWTLRSIKKIR